eukprot:m.130830 g.130830  ORF g.130830 m.130830 type:complete len:737 (-) comp15893_c0_seq1:1249-3459(-)
MPKIPLTNNGTLHLHRNASPANKFSKVALQVIDINRFQFDPVALSVLNLVTDAKHGYEVTVSDGRYMQRCIVDPEQTLRLEQHELVPLAYIQLTLATTAFNEASPDGEPCVLLQDWELIELLDTVLLRSNQGLEYVPQQANTVPSQPLYAQREVFADLNHDTIPTSRLGFDLDRAALTVPAESMGDLIEELEEHQTSVNDLGADLTARHAPRGALVLRVTKKSSIHYFARPDKLESWPMQAYLEVMDGSSDMRAVLVLWHRACGLYYCNIQEGDVIIIRNYTVKRATSFADWFSSGTIEIALNSSHPTGLVALLSEPVVQYLELDVPSWRETWTNPIALRKNLPSLDDGDSVQIAGIVSYLGRVEQRRDRLGRKSAYRWLELKDQAGRETWQVQVYANSLGAAFEDLQLNAVVLLTHLEICAYGWSPLGLPATPYVRKALMCDSMYARSTLATSLIDLQANSPSVTTLIEQSPELQTVLEFRSSKAGLTQLKRGQSLGHLPWPLPMELTGLVSPLAALLQEDRGMIPMTRVIELAATQAYRERHYVFTQGYLSELELVPLNEEASDSATLNVREVEGSKRAKPLKGRRRKGKKSRSSKQAAAIDHLASVRLVLDEQPVKGAYATDLKAYGMVDVRERLVPKFVWVASLLNLSREHSLDVVLASDPIRSEANALHVLDQWLPPAQPSLSTTQDVAVRLKSLVNKRIAVGLSMAKPLEAAVVADATEFVADRWCLLDD